MQSNEFIAIDEGNGYKMKTNIKQNTDKEIWRQPTTSYGDGGSDSGMEPHVFVTQGGGIGFNHYGTCVVRTIEEWVKISMETKQLKRKVEITTNKRRVNSRVCVGLLLLWLVSAIIIVPTLTWWLQLVAKNKIISDLVLILIVTVLAVVAGMYVTGVWRKAWKRHLVYSANITVEKQSRKSGRSIAQQKVDVTRRTGSQASRKSTGK